MALSGNLNQTQRNNIMSQFERHVFKILVTTDVASRGLDIASVTHVINFDMPKHTEEYVHRVGRTGRAGNKGNAVSLVGPKDWDSFKRVENFLQQDLSFSVLEGVKVNSKASNHVSLIIAKTQVMRRRSASHKRRKALRSQPSVIKLSSQMWRLVIRYLCRRRKSHSRLATIKMAS